MKRNTLVAYTTAAVLSVFFAACSGGSAVAPNTPTTVPAPTNHAGDIKIDEFMASSDKLPRGGGNIVLSWKVKNADQIRIDHGVGTVTANSVNVPVKRNTKFTLTATKGSNYTTKSVAILVEAKPMTYTIDPEIKPDGNVTNPDGGAVPLAASQDEFGVKSTYVANEIVVSVADPALLDEVLKQYGGTVVRDDSVPLPPKELEVKINPADLKAQHYIVRLDPSAMSLLNFSVNAQAAGYGGAFKFSSEVAAKLAAITVHEQAKGRAVTLNYVAQPNAVLNATVECATRADGCRPNAFTDPRFKETGSRSDVIGAWQFIAGRATQRRVRVAIIDLGFWFNSTTRQPNTIPEIGHDFPSIAGTYDFNANSFAIGAVGSQTACGGLCPWHGSGSASVAFGVVHNGNAAAGTGGQVSDAILLHAQLIDDQKDRAMRTAVAWGAEVVNMSFSGNCDSWCEAGNFFDDDFGEAVKDARNRGLVLLATAGNSGQQVNDKNTRPCTLDGVICVGALSDDGNTRFSSGWTSGFGPSVDIFAPTNILAVDQSVLNPAMLTTPKLTTFGGTSASAPFIAGIAAMMKSVNPSLNSDQVRDMLRNTAHTDSPDSTVTHYVNALAAVRMAANNDLLPDALEAPGAVLPLGPVDNLSIHKPSDRDSYRFSVAQHSKLRVDYSFASRLNNLNVSLRKISSCGLMTAPSTVSAPVPAGGSTYTYEVGILPPGDYSLNFGNDVTAYMLNWGLTPTAPVALVPDFREPNNTPATASVIANGESVDSPWLTFGKVRSVNIDRPSDVDYYRVVGSRQKMTSKYTTGSGFHVSRTATPLRLTLLTDTGAETAISVQSDANCDEELTLEIPTGKYIVKVESLNGGTGGYSAKMGMKMLDFFLPHAPLKFVVQKGIPLEGVLTDDVEDYPFVPDGHNEGIVLEGDGIGIALYDVNRQVVAKAEQFSVDKMPAQLLRVNNTVPGEAYFVELTYNGAVSGNGIAGKLPGKPFRLTVR